ncbi:hypothetical protein MUN82_01940 [Hymenobacter aerilatus]|uniref:Uncharacterized protein n=1 Tax=Hymenobacter aerilatus TaxID=2932251 RepID=A0A8T9SUN6_9BACT|nr:hypothetical protein [Hymenobacter aerilatus]UOR05872.1 hypothetical protein MUN82_01940 [Hymenobacter aerilatus]
MSDIKGNNIGAPITPFTTEDIYPTHLAEYGKGGLRTVLNYSALEAIISARREWYMEVVLEDTGKKYKLTKGLVSNVLTDNGNWKEVITGESYDDTELVERIEVLENKPEPETYDDTALSNRVTVLENKPEPQPFDNSTNETRLSSLEGEVNDHETRIVSLENRPISSGGTSTDKIYDADSWSSELAKTGLNWNGNSKQLQVLGTTQFGQNGAVDGSITVAGVIRTVSDPGGQSGVEVINGAESGFSKISLGNNGNNGRVWDFLVGGNNNAGQNGNGAVEGNLILAVNGDWKFVFRKDGRAGINTNSPHPSATLEVGGTTGGLLAPRLTSTQRDAISNPATSLLIYNTTTAGFQYYNSGWKDLVSAGESYDDTLIINRLDAVETEVNNLDTRVEILERISNNQELLIDPEFLQPLTQDTTGGSVFSIGNWKYTTGWQQTNGVVNAINGAYLFQDFAATIGAKYTVTVKINSVNSGGVALVSRGGYDAEDVALKTAILTQPGIYTFTFPAKFDIERIHAYGFNNFNGQLEYISLKNEKAAIGGESYDDTELRARVGEVETDLAAVETEVIAVQGEVDGLEDRIEALENKPAPTPFDNTTNDARLSSLEANKTDKTTTAAIDSRVTALENRPVTPAYNDAEVRGLIADKVDKVPGKSLLLDTEIARLSGLTNFDATNLTNRVTSVETAIGTKTDKATTDALTGRVTVLENKPAVIPGDTIQTITFESNNLVIRTDKGDKSVSLASLANGETVVQAAPSLLNFAGNLSGSLTLNLPFGAVNVLAVSADNYASLPPTDYTVDYTQNPPILTITNPALVAGDRIWGTAVMTPEADFGDYYTKTEVETSIASKVDKVAGKSLILDTEIARLAAVTNYNDTALSNRITSVENNKVDKVNGKSLVSDSEITRLATVANFDNTANNNRFTTVENRVTNLENLPQNKVTLDFNFASGYSNTYTATITTNTAKTYVAQTLNNVATVVYKVNGATVNLPFAVASGNTLEITITRSNNSLGSIVTINT